MRFIGGLVAATLVMGAAAAQAQQAPATLVVPQTGEPRTLSPNFASDPHAFGPGSNVYSHLVAMDWGIVKGTAAYGDLAKSWTVSPDTKIITFKLHENAKFHDGKPVTAHDVKFTYDTIIRKKYPSFAVLKSVKEIRVPDDHTLVIELNEPEVGFVPMLAQISNWTAKIYPKHLWEGQDGFETGPQLNAPIGSGPFKFVRWEKGQPVELEANTDYFRPRTALDRLVYRQVSDVNVARAEFDAGRLQFLPYDYAPPLAEVTALQRDPKVKVVFTPSHFSRDMQLNTTRAPMDNVMVRQAIAHSIDRDAMNRLAFNGLWTPSIWASIESQKDWINRDAKFPAFDRAKAEQLLDQAGLPRREGGWRFAVTVAPPNFVDCKAMMEVAVQQMRAVGINARIEQFDQATWFSRVSQKNFDINCYFTRYGPDPDAYREHFATGGGRNNMSYQDKELDEIALRASMISDVNERKAIYKRIQEIIVRDVPYVNLMNEVKTTIIRAGWTGFNVEESGFDTSYTWFGYYNVKPPGRS